MTQSSDPPELPVGVVSASSYIHIWWGISGMRALCAIENPDAFVEYLREAVDDSFAATRRDCQEYTRLRCKTLASFLTDPSSPVWGYVSQHLLGVFVDDATSPYAPSAERELFRRELTQES